MKKNKGTMSVEAALGLPILILVVFAWLDLCIMGYAFAVGDHALDMAALETKKLGKVANKSSEDYEAYVAASLKKSAGIMFPHVIQPGSVRAETHYFRDIDKLYQCTEKYSSADECPSSSKKPKNMALAIYSLSFKYKPMFSYFMKPIDIRREVIMIQEYERCKFKIGVRGSCA